jgi:methionyl-tRNA synthetase
VLSAKIISTRHATKEIVTHLLSFITTFMAIFGDSLRDNALNLCFKFIFLCCSSKIIDLLMNTNERMKSVRKILVTNALPYANGPIHMGHLLGYIQADIWVRAMRAMGHDVTYVCADDAHGTAIMLRAEANGISPEQQIANVQKEHERDFAGFGISFDHYDSTHSDTNKSRSQEIYLKNRDANIAIRPVTQLLTLKTNVFIRSIY